MDGRRRQIRPHGRGLFAARNKYPERRLTDSGIWLASACCQNLGWCRRVSPAFAEYCATNVVSNRPMDERRSRIQEI